MVRCAVCDYKRHRKSNKKCWKGRRSVIAATLVAPVPQDRPASCTTPSDSCVLGYTHINAHTHTCTHADGQTGRRTHTCAVNKGVCSSMSYMKQPKHSGRRVNGMLCIHIGMLCIHISLHAPLSTFHFSLAHAHAHAHAHAYTAGYGGHVWCTDKV